MFYTTASDALVSPHLKYGKWEDKLLYGLVQASYANPEFIKQKCPTPIKVAVDAQYAGLTCLALEHAGQGISTDSDHSLHADTLSSLPQLSALSGHMGQD